MGCISRLESFQQAHRSEGEAALKSLKEKALADENLFDELLRAAEHCSLGQITRALSEVGGEYRRNL